jgi:hypothetical protein
MRQAVLQVNLSPHKLRSTNTTYPTLLYDPFCNVTKRPRRLLESKTKLNWKSEAEFLDEIHTKVLRVFFLAIHSHLCSSSLRFLFKLTQPLTVSVQVKGKNLDRKPYPLPYGLRNPNKSQDYAQKPQRNCS